MLMIFYLISQFTVQWKENLYNNYNIYRSSNTFSTTRVGKKAVNKVNTALYRSIQIGTRPSKKNYKLIKTHNDD